MHYIDLSQEIYEGMTQPPSLVPTKIFVGRTHAASQRIFDGGLTASHLGILLSDHCGTHVDAQSHNDARPEAMSIDQYPIERFYSGAVCLDFSDLTPDDVITVERLQGALNAAGLSIRRGDTLLLHTGAYERLYPSQAYLLTYTGLDEPAAEWLVAQGMVNIGVDAPSIDHSRELGRDGTYPVHRILARHNVNNTENLANLARVAGQRFTYLGLPLRLRGATASPIRAVAIVDGRDGPTPVQIVDLSQDIYEGMAQGVALVPTKMFVAFSHEASQRMFRGRHTAQHLGILLCDHGSTHMEAQSHNDDRPQAMTINQYPVGRFITSAVCLDVSHLTVEDCITPEVLQTALDTTGLSIQRGDTVLLYTGTFDKLYPDPAYLTQYPGLDVAAATWLVEQGVVNIGVDSRSVDHSRQLTPPSVFPVHQLLAKRNVNNSENLANLRAVAGRRFTYVGLPLKIRGGTGSPVRAVALLET
ncbi:MAG: cyclase family protein [Verrucomicrobia bacterium]|nr:cyclase family protein [Verrucomicrobiota bacterium]